jgi:hypothetical protein
LARRPEGIFAAPFEQGEIGPDLFRKACEFNLEGLVSKRQDRAYRAGRCAHWIKVKNPKHPAMVRASKRRCRGADLHPPQLELLARPVDNALADSRGANRCGKIQSGYSKRSSG